MRFELGQRIIDRIRGKDKREKQERLLAEIKHQIQQIQDFAHYQHNQTLIYRNISTDISSMHNATGILRELQKVNLYILKRLKSICDKLDIKFWLHGGSLLGAVRHKGFVPWDDDIDVGIMRSDFETLKKHLANDVELEIKNFYFVPGICSRQPRVVFRGGGGGSPFFVDIFIYDEIHTNDIGQTWQEFCVKKNEQVGKLCATGICANKYFLLENQDHKNLIDAIYEESKFLKTDIGCTNAIIFNIDEGTNLISGSKDSFVRCFEKDFIFPLCTLDFCDTQFYAPKSYEEYLINQYGDYMLLPNNLEYSQHMIGFDKETLNTIHKFYKEKAKKNIIGYTAGAFDLFHIGHLNLLKRAKENCSYLIVGVTTDDLIEQTKGRKPVIPLEERMEILQSSEYVDKVVVQEDLDKVKALRKYHYDILFSGDDWEGDPRWIGYERELARHNVPVKYFPYTKTTSSTLIHKFLRKAADGIEQ